MRLMCLRCGLSGECKNHNITLPLWVRLRLGRLSEWSGQRYNITPTDARQPLVTISELPVPNPVGRVASKVAPVYPPSAYALIESKGYTRNPQQYDMSYLYKAVHSSHPAGLFCNSDLRIQLPLSDKD